MSLVAYGSSDESDNEEEINDTPQIVTKSSEVTPKNVNTSSKLDLPSPRTKQLNHIDGDNDESLSKQKLNFDTLLKKVGEVEIKSSLIENNIEEEDTKPLPKKVDYGNLEKPPPKRKGPAKITIPSLSDFQDLYDEENEQTRSKIKPSQKGSGLMTLLPPPKAATIATHVNSMVPHVLTKKPTEIKKPIQPKTISQSIKKIQKSVSYAKSSSSTLKSLSSYSDSEDEDEKGSSGIDFFSLSTPMKIADEHLIPMSTEDINTMAGLTSSTKSEVIKENSFDDSSPHISNEPDKTLISNVMNLPKDEILLKNKAQVGPKLPVPEQEYNVDAQGNVVFDEKAIEYLCGKRGVKRKNEFENVNIVEINGEDIKPDEREWLVKALTEEPVHRPMSAGAGPSGQSKKKHQITYLAHQAKAMELELKNQWAQNKASRQQTRSKYGF